MKILDNNEMQEYSGGFKISATVAASIAAVCAFLLGVVDGLSYPKACIR